MSVLQIVQPLPIASVSATRGTGAANLKTREPKEVWVDSAAGSAVTLTIGFAAVETIDTVLLGYVRPPAAGATWTLSCGVVGVGSSVLVNAEALRVPDVAGSFPAISHALWTGAAVDAEYLQIELTQPAGSEPLSAGVLVIGKAVAPELGQEWGFGREPIDTGEVTDLPGGGFAIVEGARKVRTTWTFGDLSWGEADAIEQLALAVGRTAPVLVIEDAARTAGLRSRIHYGLMEWRAFERRNKRQTRQELAIKQWI